MGLHFIKNGTKHDVCVKRPSLFPASATTYDNSNSGLSATRVQGAIDEVAAETSFSVTASEYANIESQECVKKHEITKVSVFCTFNAISSGSGVLVGVVPSPYRPFTTVSGVVANGYNSVMVMLTSAGEISVRCLSGSNVKSAAFTLIY